MRDGLVVEPHRYVHARPRLEHRRPLRSHQLSAPGDDVDHFFLGWVDVPFGGRIGREHGVADGEVLGSVDFGADVVVPLPAR